MKLNDITEGVTQIWGRTKGKVVRKYRCTSGSRKGRIVAKPATCNAPKRVKSSINIKKAKSRKASAMKVKSRRTRNIYGQSRRVARMNKSNNRKRTSSKRGRIK
jgi:hypothetical protein